MIEQVGSERVDMSVLETAIDDMLEADVGPALACLAIACAMFAAVALFEERRRLGSWTRVLRGFTKRTALSFATSSRPYR